MEPVEFRNLALAELDAVYRLAYHLARQSGDIEDLVQETYLRAFKFAPTYRPTEHGIRPWLFKILHNVLNTRMTREHRQRELEAIHHESLLPQLEAAEIRAEALDTIDWNHVDERLKSAIHDLSLPHRTAFLLCAVEGLSYREIAEVTEVPVGTVMSRLHRARAILAGRLAELALEQGLGKGKSDPNREMENPSQE